MILATTTGDFNCIKDHAERVRLVARAGFRHLDLSMYEIFPEDPLFSDGWQAYALELKALAKAGDIVKMLNLHRTTVCTYLKRGYNLGLCPSYSTKESLKRRNSKQYKMINNIEVVKDGDQ